MKCALPGRYGKKVSIESSVILDSYYDTDIDREKQLSEDVGLSFDDAVDQFEKAKKDFIEMLTKYEKTHKESGKEYEVEIVNDFEKLKTEILLKDKEEHSQK